MVIRQDQIERYKRHILLKEIGGAGQQKLCKARVLVVGAGGLGCSLLTYLTAAGIGRIGIIDDDKVTLSNLQRQILYGTEDVGKFKTERAQKKLNALNPDCQIDIYTKRLTGENIVSLLEQYDVIADTSDNFETRFLINDACYFEKRTLVSASVGEFDGQLLSLRSFEKDQKGQNRPCYRSFIPSIPSEQNRAQCNQGVLGAITGVIGSLQAVEVMKHIVGFGENLLDKILIYNGLNATSRIVKLSWDWQNPLNGEQPTIHDLSAYL